MDELILVDGATGFVGSNLVEYLCKKGYNVRASGRNIEKLNELEKFGAEVVRCDLLDKSQIKNKEILEGVDKIVHCTGCINVSAPWDEMYAANVQTTKNLYETALNYNVKKIIHFSSVAVYGKQKKEFLKEDDPKLADDNYGKTKFLGENIGLKLYEENGFPFSILRPAFIYGTNDPGFTYSLLTVPLLIGEYRKKKMIINWKRRIHLVSIGNVVEAVRFLLHDDTSNGEAYNILDPAPINGYEMFEYFASFLPYKETRFGIFSLLVNSDLLLSIFSRFSGTTRGEGYWGRVVDKNLSRIRKEYNLVSPTPILTGAVGRIDKYKKKYALCYDTSKIMRLGYKPIHRTTEEGIKEAINWYIDNRWIPNYENYKIKNKI